MEHVNGIEQSSEDRVLVHLVEIAASSSEGALPLPLVDVASLTRTYLRIQAVPLTLEPPKVVEWVTLDRRLEVARSVKLYNVMIDPMSAIRNALVGAREAMAAAGGASLYASSATLPATTLAGLVAAPLACLAFLLAMHFGRRRDLAYEHGCVLALAWSVSEYVDGKFLFVEVDLMSALDAMPLFGVHDFNKSKCLTALSRLAAWGAVERHGPAFMLLERVTVKDAPWK